ncbi:MAG: YncE family protein [Betaproteobacteria bacterium]|jgi:YVTN family beta-propeller protein|nr:YncE family protein [Betaproteobacteria bacterium]NBT68460.1 YncE family protein [Betaproteobacteria bacterium]NBY08148.1 YncE family protein [Betaproteobacteria bacterium]
MKSIICFLARSLGLCVIALATTAQTVNPIFVLNSRDANVSVIDPLTWSMTQKIATGKEPHHLYLTPDEKSVIVANAASDSLTFIDPKTAQVQKVIKGTLDPYQLRFSPDMKWFVTVANRLNHIDFYKWDGTHLQLAKRISSSKTPSHLWIDSKSTTVFATMQDSDELIAVDLATQNIKWRIKTGPMPADVFGTPDDKHVLVGLTGAKEVQVFDLTSNPAKWVKSIPTGEGAHAFRALGDGKHVLVSNRVANTVSKIDYVNFQVVNTYPAPGGPDCLEVSGDGKLLFISSRWIGKVTVVDLESAKVIRQIKVGKSPHGIWTLDHAKRQ